MLPVFPTPGISSFSHMSLPGLFSVYFQTSSNSDLCQYLLDTINTLQLLLIFFLSNLSLIPFKQFLPGVDGGLLLLITEHTWDTRLKDIEMDLT